MDLCPEVNNGHGPCEYRVLTRRTWVHTGVDTDIAGDIISPVMIGMKVIVAL